VLIFLDLSGSLCYGNLQFMKQTVTALLELALAGAAFGLPLMAGVPPTIPTPEPTTVLTVGAGAVALIFYARKKRSRK
jgi:hypothetical protein